MDFMGFRADTEFMEVDLTIKNMGWTHKTEDFMGFIADLW